MNAFLIVKQNIKNIGITNLLNVSGDLFNDPSQESAKNIIQIIKILKQNNFKIKLVTWTDLVDNQFQSYDLVIFPQWYITGIKNPKNDEHKKIIGQFDYIINNPINSITLHRSSFVFENIKELLWKGNKTGMMKRPVNNIFVNREVPKLTDGVTNFIEKNDFQRDYFERLSLPSAEVKPIISKTATSNSHINFLTMGYYKHNSGANQFHLSVGFVGDDYTQTQFHNLLFNNILNYLYK